MSYTYANNIRPTSPVLEAQQLEVALRDPDDYEEMISSANREDADGMISLAKSKGIALSVDGAWLLIDRYQTKGNAS